MLRVTLLTIIAVVCLIGCSSYIAPLDPNRTRSWLPFLIEGKTTKEEVLNRLGTPVNQYEDGSIVSYILRENLNSQLQVGETGSSRDWKPEIYNLVLVFGPTEILERYSIVHVR
jgi:hypothetical protein